MVCCEKSFHRSIVIKTTDKGSYAVVWDRRNYMAKAEIYVKDTFYL